LESQKTCLKSGLRNANATNIYLRNSDGLPYNTTPFILPYNGTIKYISMANSGIETWVGEVRNNGVLAGDFEGRASEERDEQLVDAGVERRRHSNPAAA
jgi:hypothetical protein